MIGPIAIGRSVRRCKSAAFLLHFGRRIPVTSPDKMIQLASALPELAEELAHGLAAAGHAELAKALYSIQIAERCRCDQPGCVTFYAVQKADAPPPSKCNRIIGPAKGVLCVQYVGQQIVWIEALGRPDDREKLDRLADIRGSSKQSVAHEAADRADC